MRFELTVIFLIGNVCYSQKSADLHHVQAVNDFEQTAGLFYALKNEYKSMIIKNPFQLCVMCSLPLRSDELVVMSTRLY